MSWQRRYEPPLGTPTKRYLSQITNNTHNHSNGQLIHTNRGIHTHKYNNIRGTQLSSNGHITQYFTNTRDNNKHKHAPFSLHTDNTDDTNNATIEPPNTTPTNKHDILDNSQFSPCSEGVVRFIHTNTGGVCSKQHFLEFKLLLTKMSISQADIYSVNKTNIDTTHAKK